MNYELRFNNDIKNSLNDINNNFHRETNNRPDSFSYSSRIEKTDSFIDKTRIDANINIYRFKFTDDFTEELFKFSKIHQYDHRHDFKEAWTQWLEDNDNIVKSEIIRLTNLGYDGDILDKMFKSARYYFRKKSTEKKAPAKRRDYTGVQKETISAMDDHINLGIKSENFKPSDGFDEFCKNNIEILKEEVNILLRNGFTNSEEIKQKIKKTYKNRYFLLISK
jgi:hypothetical protein